MTYSKWFEIHAQKHKTIVDKLSEKNCTKKQIIEYFDFENMVKNEKNFCLLYEENKKCHEISKLNCYLCACPHFRFNDEGITIKDKHTIHSKCTINSGSTFVHDLHVHHDCTSCTIPHKTNYIDKIFDLDWKKIMKECRV